MVYSMLLLLSKLKYKGLKKKTTRFLLIVWILCYRCMYMKEVNRSDSEEKREISRWIDRERRRQKKNTCVREVG